MNTKTISKLILAFSLIAGLSVAALAQKALLEFNKDLGPSKATVEKTFAPKKQTDANVYYIRFRYHQMIDMTVVSNSVFLSEENECGMYFKIYDSKDKELWLGDSPTGIDIWKGEIKTAGIHKVKLYMDCLEAYTPAELRKKAPKFKYKLEILGSKSPTR